MSGDRAGNQRTVLVTARNVDPVAIQFLVDHGYTVRHPPLNGRDPAPEALPALLQGADGWILGSTNVGYELMAANPRLRVLARRGVGYEQIDLAAAEALGRVVTVAAGGNGPSVADHAIGLILAVAKQLVLLTEQMRQGDWTYRTGFELHEKTVGIIGLGRIGKLVTRRLRGFDVRVIATDIVPDHAFAAENGVTFTDLRTLLHDSDVVTIHAPLTERTRNLIGAGALSTMKPDAILINTARGGIIDEAALLHTLENGHLAGAGLDVFWAEKDAGHTDTALKLVRLPNVVATPHTAAATREGLARTNLIAAQTVVAVLEGSAPPPDCIVTDGRRGATSSV